MSMRVTVEGVQKTIQALKKKQEDLLKAMDQSVKETALFIEREAKLRAPVRTGALRSSIHIEALSENQAVVADGVAYGIFVEFGTSQQAAQPFMRPAADLARKEFKQIAIGKVRSSE